LARVTGRLIFLGSIAALIGCVGDLRDRIEQYVGIADTGIVYVDGSSGDDGNPGSAALPKRSIEAAMDLAVKLGEPRSVCVAEGVYLMYEPLRIVEGISVRGGYASGSWQRDIAAHPTRIQAVGVDVAIEPESSVTSGTLLEGLLVVAAPLDTAACIWCNGCSPTIARCTLNANAAIKTSIGIYLQNTSAVIESCTIFAGAGNDYRWGIRNEGSSSRIRNCVVLAEDGMGEYTGIYCKSGSDTFIQNNTVWAGTGAYDTAICISDSHCTIDNNIFFPSGSGCGIWELGTNALPVRVWHNDFWCSIPYHGDGSPLSFSGMIYRFDDKNIDHLNNVDPPVDPDFVNAGSDDYHLEGSSPIAGAGCDLSACFTTDRDGVARTISWSIGAYERD
jgi:hypothetical protein